MAKQGGLGSRLWVDGYDLSGDINALDKVTCPRGVLDFTDITELAHERQLSTQDGAIDVTSFFDVAAGNAHPVLSTLPTTDRELSFAIPTAPASGLAIGDPCASMVGKQINYDGQRQQDGSFMLKVAAQANAYGLEWGYLATAGIRADTTATNGASLDGGATGTTNFGFQAYLQVLSFTGTSVTIKIQGSTDNGGTDPFADVTGGAFATVSTSPQAQRIATASNAAIKRYLRVVTTGTFSQCSFVVAITRNPLAVAF